MLNMQQLVVGIFRNRTHVQQAINELHQIGFDNRHIRFAKHGISIGGILNKIKSSSSSQDIAAGRIYNDLVNMGMPPEDARYYQSEFKAGHSIIAIQRSGVPLVAASILIRNGGHIVNEHIAQFTDYGQVTTTQEPATENIHTELNNANEHVAPSTDNGQNTNAQQPPTEDVKTELNSANENITQSTDHEKGEETQKLRKDLIKA